MREEIEKLLREVEEQVAGLGEKWANFFDEQAPHFVEELSGRRSKQELLEKRLGNRKGVELEKIKTDALKLRHDVTELGEDIAAYFAEFSQHGALVGALRSPLVDAIAKKEYLTLHTTRPAHRRFTWCRPVRARRAG